MALQKDLTLCCGLTVPSTYIRIDEICGGKSMINLVVCAYNIVDGEKKKIRNALSGEKFSFVPSIEEGADNFIAQGYAYLKTLDIFSGSLDV